MAKKSETNIYRDWFHGGWVLEVLAMGEWITIGVFGSREAALARAMAKRAGATTALRKIEVM